MSDFVGKVLIVDDDDGLRQMQAMFFEFESWEVFEAHNGLVAQQILEETTVDLVVSDIKMPVVDGLELLKFVKSRKIDCKFVLTTGFSEILETIDAHEQGVDNFIAKPFNSKQLAEVVDKTINSEEEEASELQKQEFVDLMIEDFYSAKTLLSDIYVKLAGGKRVMVAKAGEVVPKERFSSYKSKGVDMLSIRTEDFPRYVKFNLNLSEAIRMAPSVPEKQKRKQMVSALKAAVTGALIGEIDSVLFNSGKSFLVKIVETLMESDDHFSVLSQMREHSNLLFDHSVVVALYSCLVAQKLGWNSARLKTNLTLGGIYHDVGKKELPVNLFEKPRYQFTEKEIKLWESHPLRGRNILEQLGGVSSEVLNIVSYHHNHEELNTGAEYQISSPSKQPLASVVGLVDLFVNLCFRDFKEHDSPAKMALNKITEFHSDKFDAKFIDSLYEVFGYYKTKMDGTSERGA